MPDLFFGAFMAVVLASSALAYTMRAVILGRVHHDRADKDGGSAVMGKDVVEFAYWVFEPLAKGLHRLGFTPNAITLLSLLPGLGAGIAAGAGWLGLACMLATAGAFCDALDGLVARKRAEASDAGEALDASVDRYMEFFFQAGLVVHYRRHLGLLLIALAGMLGAYMVSYSTAKAEALDVEPPRGAMRRAERAVYLLIASGFTPIVGWLVGPRASLWLRESPIIAVMILVAVVANFSVVRRIAVIVQRVRAKEAAEQGERTTLTSMAAANAPTVVDPAALAGSVRREPRSS